MDTTFTATKPKLKKKFGLKWIILIIALILALFVALIGFITDFLWFSELGYVSVFLTKLFTQLKLGIPTFIIVTFLAYIYFKYLKINYYHKIKSQEIDKSRRTNMISWLMAAIFGAIVTWYVVSKMWFNQLQFSNSSSFDLKDPLFGIDISFYTFKLEFVTQLNTLLLVVLVIFLILTLIYYSYLMGSSRSAFFTKDSGQGTGADFGEDKDFGENAFKSVGKNPFASAFENIGSRFKKAANKAGSGFGNDFGGPDGFGEGASDTGETASRKKGMHVDSDNLRRLMSIASKQLTIVGVVFFIMLGIHFLLRQYTLLHAHTGAVYGAGWTDVHVTLWVYRIMIGLSVLGAVAVIVGMKMRRLKFVVIIVISMVLVSLIGTGTAKVIQNFVVSPDEINKESKYLERNIEYTQHAYGLDDVTEKKFSASDDLTAEDIQNNEPTLSNIRINDFEPTEKFYNQTQSIRQYYDFSDVDVDRYTVNGSYTQTFLSAREIDESKISDTWLNRHLKYTHGYGITMSAVDQITSSGQPDMLIKSIPPESDVSEIEITRPEVYFGENTDDYIVVDTDEDEFDYPDGDSNKYTRYEGSAGIKMNLFNRLCFAIKERSAKLLVSSNINSDSRIVINRNIEERVKKIMPYLTYDEDPYLTTVDGRLYWIIDAYTTTSNYPYSEPYSDDSDSNYIRNSVKVVVDAYNGDVNYYIVDKDDAIAKTYQKIYPKLFKDYDEMPDGIKEHIRYPSKMFEAQSKIYRRYHMNDVKVFYQNEDLWDISDEIYGTEEQQMTPNYYILNLPGEDKEEFVSSIPYTPKDKKNLTGLLVARNDGDNYGELVLYTLPKSKVTYGPMQVEAQIDQNAEISKEFSLWNSSGSTYTRGNMFVIPIEDSLLYVEPVYLEATNSSIPEVKRVIVCYNDKIAYESTLAEALDSLFGDGAGDKYKTDADTASSDSSSSSESSEMSQAELIENAQDAYDKAQDALKDGDWSEYGKQMDKLEGYLNKLK